MAAFAIEDSLFKMLAGALPVGQVLILFGAGGAFVFALWAFFKSELLLSENVISRPMRYRFLFEITGRLFYFLAVTLTTLSSATVILQATPIVVVAGASVLFSERVSWIRWLLILIGLIGVLLVINPTSASFSPLSVLAVIGMLGLAGRDLASRAAPARLDVSVLGFYGFVSVFIAGAVFSLWDARPFLRVELPVLLLLLAAISAGVIAYSCLMKAMRTGAVSAVTPFRYSRLLFGVALGVIAFDESLTVLMLIGCAFVVLSGMAILWTKDE